MHNPLDAAAVHHHRHGQHHIVQPVFALHQHAHGQHGMLVDADGADDAEHAAGDAVVGVHFAVENFQPGLLGLRQQLVFVKFRQAVGLTIIVQALPRHLHRAPRNHAVGAVFAPHHAENVFRVEVDALGYDFHQPRRINHTARTHYLLRRERCVGDDEIGQNIARIGHHNHHCAGRVAGDFLGDIYRNRRIHRCQLQPILPFFDLRACGNHHHIGAGNIGIIAGDDARVFGKRKCAHMAEIHLLAFAALAVQIHNHQLAAIAHAQ